MATANAESEVALSAALDAEIRRAADTAASACRATVLTGAGLSVEGGIPPLHGPGLLWHAAGGSNRSVP